MLARKDLYGTLREPLYLENPGENVRLVMR